MPPFTVTSTYVRGAVAMAIETLPAERPSGDSTGRKVAIILAAVVISTVSAGVIVFFTFRWVRSRTPANHMRLDDEQNPNEEPIPLQDLPPPEDRGTIDETGNPPSSTSTGRRRRTLNEFTMALSSNPPSQTDLATAEQTLNPRTKIKKQDVGVPAIIVCHPAPVLILPTWPKPSPSQEQSHLRPTRQTSSPPDDRRYSKVFESGDNQGSFMGDGVRLQSNLPPLPPAGPGIETMPNVLDEYHQQQRQTALNSEFFPPSTIAEESTPDITEGPDTESNVELAENISESNLVIPGFQSPEANNNEDGIGTEHDDEPLPPSREDEHNHDNEVLAQGDGANDADDESDKPISPTADSGVPFEGGGQSSRGNWHHSYADEVYDPKDPRYDVEGAVRALGKNNGPESNNSKAEQGTQSLSGGDVDDDSSHYYTWLQRDFTNASLVPPPLSVLIHRNNTVHETSSSASTPAPTTQPAVRPSSAADFDTSPLEPEIETGRPRSFVIREWPPDNSPNATFDNAPERQALWHTPPSQEIIERSRRAREQMEWEEEARKVVLQKAKDAGETLSDEEIARRVRRMYERSSRFTLGAITYRPATPPARPRDTMSADSTRSGRVRAQRAQRAPSARLPGNENIRASQNNRPVRPEPAFASSQALPFAASTTSVIAQDGSRSGSPPPPPHPSTPPPPPRNRLRRSNPDHHVSRPN
ncbi:hypothetical protein F5B21DRAFT_503368 [Xylaria acuta]|nr:hypothetical protein F5B21DRAFT_503368 [Xylaria acuta]